MNQSARYQRALFICVMIQLENFGVSFGGRDLYKDINLLITINDRLGLVGINGSGKSTLLKIMAGAQTGHSGRLHVGKDTKLGYLPQEMAHAENETVENEAKKAFAEINALNERQQTVTHLLETRTDYQSHAYSALIEELTSINDRLDVLGEQDIEQSVAKVLFGLGFTLADFSRKMNEFSGGWKMRVELAKILLAKPDILLLDEPTNHLDIDSIEWLENFLKNSRSGIILISHDRQFLDNITSRTLDIRGGKILDYKLNYSKYEEQRDRELQIQAETHKNQQKFIADTEKLIDKFRAKQSKAAFAQSLIKKLDRLEKVELDNDESVALNIKFPPAPRSGKFTVNASGLSKSYDGKSIFKNVDILIGRGEKVAVIGKNGVGKSTLVRIITGSEPYDGIVEPGHNIHMSYFAQDEADKLDKTAKVFDIVDREGVGEIRKQLRGLLGAFLFSGDDVNKKVSVLSGGEKTRLALCRMLLTPTNLLILDEPTNHLDMKSKDVLKQALQAYDGSLLVISHDREFLHGLTDRIVELTAERTKEYIGDIYDFLKERQAATIASYEYKGTNTEKPIARQRVTLEVSNEEKKRLEKERKKLESESGKLEGWIEAAEKSIADLSDELQAADYRNGELMRDLTAKLDSKKMELENLMVRWEEAQLKLSAST